MNFAQPAYTWRRLGTGVHQYVNNDRFPRVLGEVWRNGSKWLASTGNFNDSGFSDNTDKSTLRDAKLWIERYAR